MELELRIALLLIGLAAIIALYFFSKSKRAVLKREDDEYNFQNNDLPDPLELDQALELDDDLAKTNDHVVDGLLDSSVNGMQDELGDLVREDIAERTTR